MDTFLNGDNDQPTCCPYCGNRTDFYELSDERQIHRCLNNNCAITFELRINGEVEEIFDELKNL